MLNKALTIFILVSIIVIPIVIAEGNTFYIYFRITSHYCGDGTCTAENETCGTTNTAPECFSDCGTCQTQGLGNTNNNIIKEAITTTGNGVKIIVGGVVATIITATLIIIKNIKRKKLVQTVASIITKKP